MLTFLCKYDLLGCMTPRSMADSGCCRQDAGAPGHPSTLGWARESADTAINKDILAVFAAYYSLLQLFSFHPARQSGKIAGNCSSCHVIAHTCRYLHIKKFWRPGASRRPLRSLFQRIPAYSNVFSCRRRRASNVFQLIPAYSRIKKIPPEP